MAVDQPENTLNEDGLTPKRKLSPMVVVLVVILVACLAGGIAGGAYLVGTYSQIKDAENSQAIEPTIPEKNADGSPVPAPIDFDALKKQNPDIYAWIYVPGTDINFPVCQNVGDASYYLSHNASKQESQLGAIFSEAQFNNTDFQDPVTVLYGHNGFGNTMFTALHKLESSDFFKENEKFYVFVPGHIYTYEIVSAFMSNGNHLMGEFNFQTEEGMAGFINYISNPSAVGAMAREVQAGTGDKFVVLSTCNEGALESVGRYLVCGVMVDDQPTK